MVVCAAQHLPPASAKTGNNASITMARVSGKRVESQTQGGGLYGSETRMWPLLTYSSRTLRSQLSVNIIWTGLV